MIKIDQSALDRIISQAENHTYFRVGLKAGGCMGVSQHFEFTNSKRDNDLVLEEEGITILVDPKSAELLDGSTLKWSGNLLKRELVWEMPKQPRRCSCGASLSL